jgi:hypothetical protein
MKSYFFLCFSLTFYLSRQTFFRSFTRAPEGDGVAHEIHEISDSTDSVGSSPTALAEAGENAQEIVDSAQSRPQKAPITNQNTFGYAYPPTQMPSLDSWTGSSLPTGPPTAPVKPVAEVSRNTLTLFPLVPSNIATPPLLPTPSHMATLPLLPTTSHIVAPSLLPDTASHMTTPPLHPDTSSHMATPPLFSLPPPNYLVWFPLAPSQMINIRPSTDWKPLTFDESSLRVRQRVKTLNSNGYQQMQTGIGHAIPEPTAIQTWSREGKKPMELIRENKFHYNNADTSARQVNAIQTIGFLHSGYFQEAQKTVMKTNGIQTTSTPSENHEAFKLVKQFKRKVLKLPPNFRIINDEENTLFIHYVNQELVYPEEKIGYRVRIVMEISQEIADEQINKAELNPTFYNIITSLNLADKSNVETLSRGKEIPGYIASLSKTVMGFALIYIYIRREEEEIEKGFIEIILDYLKSFYHRINDGKLAEMELEMDEEVEFTQLQTLLIKRNQFILGQNQMNNPRSLTKKAWRIFNCLMKKNRNTLIGDFISFRRRDSRKQMIEKILLFSRKGKKRSRES